MSAPSKRQSSPPAAQRSAWFSSNSTWCSPSEHKCEHKCVLFVLVAICLRPRALCLSHSLSLSFTSDVDEFLFLYHLCFSSFYSPCFSLSLPHPLFFAAVHIHNGSGSHFDFCPRPCSSTCRMGHARNPPTLWTTLRVYPVLLCPLCPCYHRMCVIARRTGLSPLARTCSRTWDISEEKSILHQQLGFPPLAVLVLWLRKGSSLLAPFCLFASAPLANGISRHKLFWVIAVLLIGFRRVPGRSHREVCNHPWSLGDQGEMAMSPFACCSRPPYVMCCPLFLVQ